LNLNTVRDFQLDLGIILTVFSQRAIEGLFKITGRVGLWDVIHKSFPRRITVLAYHRVIDLATPTFSGFTSNVSASPEMFSRQMETVKSRFNVIDLERLLRWLNGRGELPPHPLLITFDDGYADTFTHAYPVLLRLNLPATLFVTSGNIDSRSPFYWDLVAYVFRHTKKDRFSLPGLGRWVWNGVEERDRVTAAVLSQLKRLPHEDKDRLVEEIPAALDVAHPQRELASSLLSWDQVREMSEHGIAIGGHSHTHTVLTRASGAMARDEILKCKKRIEEEIQQPVLVFAYANGTTSDFNLDHERMLAEAGYRAAFSALPGPVAHSAVRANPFAIRRVSIYHQDGRERFIAKLMGASRVGRGFTRCWRGAL
jgi:peptidoglycan/xylan/chitin deacetylase (PgdA/CDA1 family)